MSINIESLSAKELSALIVKANQRKKKLVKRKPAVAVRKKIAALIKGEGYTFAELFGAQPSRAARAPKAGKAKGPKAGGKVAPKYRNPAKPAETWAARGKQPRWLAAEIAKGRKLEEFAIK
jgi:DNA-binding protein H-NS